jgi:hypothetical protein
LPTGHSSRDAVVWLTVLTLGLAFASRGWAQPAAVPPSQAAFRTVLVTYDQRAEVETDVAHLRALAADRAAALAKALGEGLRFERWRLVLSGTEPTPMGGLFLRFLDSTLDAPKSVRPTYWNSGPGPILRQAEITAKSPLYGPAALLKRGTMVVVSGHFFPGDDGGPYYESARISWQDLSVERARFRAPYFSIKLEELDELFPERRFP